MTLNEPEWNYTIFIAVDIYGNVSILGHEDESKVHPGFTPTDFKGIVLNKSPGVYKCKWYWLDGEADYESDIYNYEADINIRSMELLWSSSERKLV